MNLLLEKPADVSALSPLTLAFVGDSVFDLRDGFGLVALDWRQGGEPVPYCADKLRGALAYRGAHRVVFVALVRKVAAKPLELLVEP